MITAAEADKGSGRKPVKRRELESPRYPRLTSFLELMLRNESERKYRFSIIEMKKNFHELNLVIWIRSYNPRELLITNTTLPHIVERGRGFCFFLNIMIFFSLLFLHINIVVRSLSSVPSIWRLVVSWGGVTCHFFNLPNFNLIELIWSISLRSKYTKLQIEWGQM